MTVSFDSIAVSEFPDELTINPINGQLDLDIAVPGSKSITNRCLVIGALAPGCVTLTGVLRSDDIYFMTEGLKALGFKVVVNWDAGECRVWGQGGEIPAHGAEIFAGAAGTVMRFLSAFVSLGRGRFRLDGTTRMRERPIEDLLQSLRMLGVKARSELDNRCPPVIVDADGLAGGTAIVNGSRSSQYISALLLIAPYARSLLQVEIADAFVSRPFVELTLKIMSDFGVLTATDGERIYRPTHGARYRAGEYRIEGDATAASYFLGAAAILGGRCCVTNIPGDSSQGDLAFTDVLQRMGCRVRKGFLPGYMGVEVSRDPKIPLKAVDADMNDIPDVAQTLAAVCMFADGSSTILNAGNLRIKETDRLAALAIELRRMGAEIKEGDDYLEITPQTLQSAKIETYNDHRMAMAMSLVGLRHNGITIKNPACVSKTYPYFFDDLKKLKRY
ncbi:MAG: 3-phosphoshikimate 1-carboxyvinyltransferase [Planctomycetota bacterium]